MNKLNIFAWILAGLLSLTTLNVSAAQQVVLHTNLGDIILELDAAKAPKTVKNFLSYVNSGFYDGTIFHRTIAGFMIQAGGFTTDMVKKTTKAPIANESTNGLSNVKGSIAMARTADPDSATSQFFINTVDNPNLDASYNKAGYAVFGRVIAGMDLVEKISKVPTGVRARRADVPKTSVVIEKAELLAE